MEKMTNQYEIKALELTETGEAKVGTNVDEVVIGLAPAFLKFQTKTLVDTSHSEILTELIAGIEEEGLKARTVRFIRTSDVSFIANDAAKIS